MKSFKLKKNQTAYDVLSEYIKRYWDYNIYATLVVSIEQSYDGIHYESGNIIAYPYNMRDVEFLDDWWEGEQFINILGIKNLQELNITGGLYDESI